MPKSVFPGLTALAAPRHVPSRSQTSSLPPRPRYLRVHKPTLRRRARSASSQTTSRISHLSDSEGWEISLWFVNR